MNLGKLLALRDDHESLRDAYRSLSERARLAMRDALQARQIVAMTPAQQSIIDQVQNLPVERLELLDLKPFGFPADYVSNIVVAELRAANLRREAELLSEKFRQSALMVAKLSAYADRN